MAKRRATLVKEYVDAMRDLAALEKQKAADPAGFKASRWVHDYLAIKQHVQLLRRGMYGGEIGKAHALLARPAAEEATS